MGNLGHQAARLAASKICDNIVKGLCKDPETEVVKLIDMWQKFMGDEKIDLNYDSARKMICDKDCTLNKYMHRLINEIDPHVLKTIALNLGFEAFVYGTKTIRKNREKYGCNVVSNDKVIFNGGHASIVGGKVYGCAGIEVQNLGNDAFIKTEVHVGVHKKIKIKIAELEKLVDQKQMLLNNINAGIKQIEQMMGSAADGMNLEEKKLALVRAKIEKTAELTEDKEELERLKGIVERSTGATVQVLEHVYPNVEVCINNSKLVTKEEFDKIEFKEKDKAVVMLSMK